MDMDAEDPSGRFDELLDAWSRRDFIRRMGGATAFMLFSAGGMQVLEACAPQNSTQQGSNLKPVKGGRLVEGSISDISSFNSLNSGDVNSTQMIHLVFASLLVLDAKGNLVPDLATEVPKVSSDGLSYTFKLRDAKWSDGNPITSADVAFTYGLMYRPENKDFVSRYAAEVTDHLASVETPDPQTVVFKMKSVWANFLDSHAYRGILPKHVLGGVAPKALNTHEFFTGPTVCSGVFKFVKWDKGSQVVLARNDSFWRGPSYLDQYVFKIVTDAVVMAQQLKTGELDCGQPDASQWDNLATADNVNRVKYLQAGFVYYAYNLDPTKSQGGKIFQDKAVRKALLMALDRPSMARAVYFGQAEPADSVEPSVSWAYNKDVKPKYKYDKAAAEDMLQKAGWVKGSDGIRAKGDLKLKFVLNTNSGNKVRENIIQVMQQQWKDIGVEATPVPIAFQQLVTQLRSTKTFDSYVLGISNNDTDPDQTTLWTTKGTSSAGLNGGNYKNPEVDKLMDDALGLTDRAKRKEIYFKIQDILAEDLPAPILFYPYYLWGINKRVQNFKVDTFNSYQTRPWMKDVFVTDGK